MVPEHVKERLKRYISPYKQQKSLSPVKAFSRNIASRDSSTSRLHRLLYDDNRESLLQPVSARVNTTWASPKRESLLRPQTMK